MILRLIQGFAVGGEISGASAMILEHSPFGRRGYYASFSLQGVQAGQILAAAVFLPLSAILSEEAFLSWGWRIPFLLSAVVVFAGYVIRKKVDETPAFQEEADEGDVPGAPIAMVVRENGSDMLRVICMALMNAVPTAATVFGAAYATSDDYGIGFSDDHVPVDLGVGEPRRGDPDPVRRQPVRPDRPTAAASSSGRWARPRCRYAYLWAISQGNASLAFLLAILMWGIVYQGYNAVFPAFYQELFPTRTRVTGFAVSQNIGTLITAFLPALYAAVAPAGSNVPLIVGSFTFGIGDHRGDRGVLGAGDLPRAPGRPRQEGRAGGAPRGVRAAPPGSLGLTDVPPRPRRPGRLPVGPAARFHPSESPTMTSVLVLNGPNLNLLGTRKPEVYGSTSLADVEKMCQEEADKLDLELVFRQSNHEGQLIDWIHEFGARGEGRHLHRRRLQPGRAHPHLGRAARRDRGRRAAGDRAAHLERAQAGGVPAPLVHLAGRPRDHRRLRRTGLPDGDQRPAPADAVRDLTRGHRPDRGGRRRSDRPAAHRGGRRRAVRRELAAIVDPFPAGAGGGRQVRRRRCYGSLAELFETDRPDGVILATPNQLHVDGGLECVAAGVPVIVEKPIGDTVEGATRLVEAAEAAGVPLLTGHHRNYSPIMAKAREIVQSGVLGSIVAVVGTALFYKPDDYFDVGGGWRRQPGGGPILLNLIHEVNNLQSLVGDVVRVQATTSNATRGFPVEDTAAMVFTFANGALGTFLLSDTAASPRSWEQTSQENTQLPDVSRTRTATTSPGTRGSLSVPTMRLKVFAGEPLLVASRSSRRRSSWSAATRWPTRSNTSPP